jgi:hypothetical protein
MLSCTTSVVTLAGYAQAVISVPPAKAFSFQLFAPVPCTGMPHCRAFYRRMHGVTPLAHSLDVALDFHRSQPIKLHESRDCNHGCS